MDGQLAALQHVDLLLIDVKAEDFEPQLGHACRVSGTQISGPKHREAVRHGMLPSYLLFVVWHSTGASNCPKCPAGKLCLAQRYGVAQNGSTPPRTRGCPVMTAARIGTVLVGNLPLARLTIAL
ncbi:hypothetical protein Pth03_16310 [Planotetraspora thailandica]|uniref:Uncharacterized protein n=1 Tax=Planotetraspora thailandica TaxID=487172 RepID=A0A8J3XSH8_9ACTN|nr:hypothetical protein Pth03_16310 [Planotetraspora thailandica]